MSYNKILTEAEIRQQALEAFDRLTFADDFMFWKVLTTHLELCRRFLEAVLDKKVRAVAYPEVSPSGAALASCIYVL